VRKLLAALSDTHAGHRFGLMDPSVTLYDEDEQGNLIPYTPEPSAIQRWLWRCYQDDVANAMAFANGDPLVVLHNGDLTWGRKYARELVSTREADQILIAVANMQPWFEYDDLQAVRFSHGTGSHAFYEATAAVLVSEQLRALHPDTDIGVVRHGLLSLDGVRVDYAHHGPTPGIRQWTQGNQLRYYLRSLMNDEIIRGREPPRVVIRSHYHTYCRETLRVHGACEWVSDIVVTPAYCGLSEYAQQATRSGYLIGRPGPGI